MGAEEESQNDPQSSREGNSASFALENISAGETQVRYLRSYRVGAPELLFLHGYGSRLQSYLPLLEYLSDSYSVTAPLIFGVGYLEQQPHTYRAFAEILRNFIQATGLESYHLVGHSYGANVALLSARSSDRARSVALINPGLSRGVRLLFKDALSGEGELQGILSNPEIGVAYARNFFAMPGTFARTTLSMGDFRFDGPELPCPGMLLYSEMDALFDPDGSCLKGLTASFRRLSIERVNGKSHNWVMYYPELAASKTLAFLNAQV